METSKFVGFLVVVVLFIIGCNLVTNEVLQSKCSKKGGVFYRSLDASHSLCQLPKGKDNAN